jgi:predicted phosphodiesterase
MKIAICTDTHYGFYGDKTRKRHTKFLKKLAKAIEDNQCELLCHNGDWISSKNKELENTFKQFREYIKVPILTVFGNHDLWDDNQNPNFKIKYEEKIKLRQELIQKYNITHVLENPFTIGNYFFTGFDGWYNEQNPPTNDLTYIGNLIDGKRTHDYLATKAYNDLSKILNYETDKIKVCLTHFPPFAESEKNLVFCANPKFLDVIKENFNILLVGHSHKECDFLDGKLRIINAGSEYNEPVFKIIEI